MNIQIEIFINEVLAYKNNFFTIDNLIYKLWTLQILHLKLGVATWGIVLGQLVCTPLPARTVAPLQAGMPASVASGVAGDAAAGRL